MSNMYTHTIMLTEALERMEILGTLVTAHVQVVVNLPYERSEGGSSSTSCYSSSTSKDGGLEGDDSSEEFVGRCSHEGACSSKCCSCSCASSLAILYISTIIRLYRDRQM